MIEGIRCPPATHKYRAHGKVLYCSMCGDVQPILIEESAGGSTGIVTVKQPPPDAYYEQPPEPTAADMEAHIARLREAAGLAEREAEQQTLFGQRNGYDGDLSDLEMQRDLPRSRVDEGYNTDPREDRLPSAGL